MQGHIHKRVRTDRQGKETVARTSSSTSASGATAADIDRVIGAAATRRVRLGVRRIGGA